MVAVARAEVAMVAAMPVAMTEVEMMAVAMEVEEEGVVTEVAERVAAERAAPADDSKGPPSGTSAFSPQHAVGASPISFVLTYRTIEIGTVHHQVPYCSRFLLCIKSIHSVWGCRIC